MPRPRLQAQFLKELQGLQKVRDVSLKLKNCSKFMESLQAMATAKMASPSSTSETLLVVAVTLLVIYVTYKMVSMLPYKGKLTLPPGPPALPIIGSLHLLGTHPHHNLAAMARKYGPVMSVRLGQKLCIVATSADAAKEFLKFQDANFCSRPRVRAAQLLMPQDIVFNDNTPVFRQLRKMMQGELTSAKRLEASKHIRTEEAAFMLQSISQQQTGLVQLKTHLNVMATNILSRMVLNKRFLSCDEVTDEVREFRDIIEGMLHCFAAIHPKDFFSIPEWVDPLGLDARFLKQRARMDAFYSKMVSQHREYRRRKPVAEEGETTTMLDVLLEHVETEPGVTEEHAKGMVWDVFSAGTDTSVLTSEWAMAEVLRNPAVMATAQLELDQVVGKTRTVRESDIPQLKYLQAIVKEALRLHGPLPMLPHQSINACKVMGFDIPAHTRVFVNAWGIARDPRHWHNPLHFHPDRFHSPESQQRELPGQGQQFEYLPFGSGRRSCPGMSFGSIAVSMQVGSLLHAFDWSLHQQKEEELDMAEGRSFTIAMRTPLAAFATPRLPEHLYQCHLTCDD